jgi:hypothetical protein
MPSKDNGTVDSVDKHVTDMGGVTGLEHIINGKDDNDEQEAGHSTGAGENEGTSEEDEDSADDCTSEEDETDEETDSEEEDSDDDDDTDTDEDTDEEDDDDTDGHDEGSEDDSHGEDISEADSQGEDGSEVDDTDDESETQGHKPVKGDNKQAVNVPDSGQGAGYEITSAAVTTKCKVTADRGISTGHEVSLACELVLEQEYFTYQRGAIDPTDAYGSLQAAPSYPPQPYGEHKIAPDYPQYAYGEGGITPNHPPQARAFVTQEEHFMYNETVFDHPDVHIRDFGNPNNAPPPIKKLGRFQSFTGSIKSTISDKEKREKMVHGIQSGLEHMKDALNDNGAKEKGIMRSGAVQSQVVETYQYIPMPEHASKSPSKSGKVASTSMKVRKGVLKVGYKVAKHHPAFATVRLAKDVYDALEHSSAKAGKS